MNVLEDLTDNNITDGMALAEKAAEAGLAAMAKIVAKSKNDEEGMVAAAYASALIIAKLNAAKHTQDFPEFGELIDKIISVVQPDMIEEAKAVRERRENG